MIHYLYGVYFDVAQEGQTLVKQVMELLEGDMVTCVQLVSKIHPCNPCVSSVSTNRNIRERKEENIRL
jgi:hypothetical protein